MKTAFLDLLLLSQPLTVEARDTEDLLSTDSNPYYGGKRQGAAAN